MIFISNILKSLPESFEIETHFMEDLECLDRTLVWGEVNDGRSQYQLPARTCRAKIDVHA